MKRLHTVVRGFGFAVLALVVMPLAVPVYAEPLEPIRIVGVESGESGETLAGHLRLWHDPTGEASLEEAIAGLATKRLREGSGSTGLQEGAFWSHFVLMNTGDAPRELRLEYIDHQLISLMAYHRPRSDESYALLVDLALDRSFSHRPVPHHRFVVPVTLPPGEPVDFVVRYGSHQKGFVFPELRIWSPEALSLTQAREIALMTFLAGGLLVMAMMAVAGGIATGARFYYAYALHALASTAVWFTVFGYTHQFLLQNSYHWNYMSYAGAASLFTGLLFAREFLQSRQHLPRLDWVLLFLMADSLFLFLSALAGQTALAVISITLALLLYPVVSIAGMIRWSQGAPGAGWFAVAWTFLVLSLFYQALRDLGVVEHNLLNYYWPAVASFGEMVVIIAAMTVRIIDLRRQKDRAEQAQLQQLEQSRLLLESEVEERTRELAAAKAAAEAEARTDPLTGIHNRRSFMARGQSMLDRCRREQTSLNLMMIDIDHFKTINDENGHAVGDRALVSFASLLKSLLRERDLFGRLGGEEFGVLFVSALPAAVATAERVRERTQALPLHTEQGAVRFTVSIGIASLDDDTELETLIQRADGALYRAKHEGRDRVAVAGAADLDWKAAGA